MMNPETHHRRQEAAPAPMSGLRLNTLRRTTALALLGVGVISLFQFLLVWFVRGAVVLPLLIAALVTLVGVAGILRRWRFAPGVGALVALAPVVTVLATKGESLVLVEDDSVEHIIQNGTWTPSGLPHPQTEPGAPLVHSLDLKGGSLHIGPFTTAGVFHLYCTIHQGMSLTIVVQ